MPLILIGGISFNSLMEKIDISRHLLINPFSLDFYDYIFSASENRSVHLGNRSRALWLLFYGGKYSLPRAAIGPLRSQRSLLQTASESLPSAAASAHHSTASQDVRMPWT